MREPSETDSSYTTRWDLTPAGDDDGASSHQCAATRPVSPDATVPLLASSVVRACSDDWALDCDDRVRYTNASWANQISAWASQTGCLSSAGLCTTHSVSRRTRRCLFAA
jgi:hypothetical protein